MVLVAAIYLVSLGDFECLQTQEETAISILAYLHGQQIHEWNQEI